MYIRDPYYMQREWIHSWPTIMVIERPAESYDQYHERKNREESARRVPFGFARALTSDQENQS